VRILVQGRSGGSVAGRLEMAAAGLALRGHEVLWQGGGAPVFPAGRPATWCDVPGGLLLARHSADIVMGGPGPIGAAVAGWLAGARCMVLAVDAGALRRWGQVERAALTTLPAWALIDEVDGPAVQVGPQGLDREQIVLWPPEDPPAAPVAEHPDTEVLERVCERALARQRGRAQRAGVFVDRDGTLVVERGYLSDPAGVELLPGATAALHDLKAAGLPLIVISNQSGVGRGLFPLSRVYEVMARLRVEMRAAGIELDGIYFCPHRPEDDCACRKPGTLLLERAAEDHLLSLRGSFMVGDKLLDAETVQRAGGHGVLVRSGYGRLEEERSLGDRLTGHEPDRVCDDLAGASAWILATLESAEQK
jgi:D-glycero-D-manno-heptose 1,7-bisphosphate phosphatase